MSDAELPEQLNSRSDCQGCKSPDCVLSRMQARSPSPVKPAVAVLVEALTLYVTILCGRPQLRSQSECQAWQSRLHCRGEFELQRGPSLESSQARSRPQLCSNVL